MREVFVSSVEDFVAKFEEHKREGPLLALFVGSVDPSTGENWCGDCRNAHPFIHNAYASGGEKTIIISEVGVRDVWKNPENSFRKHQKTRLRCVPTLIRYQNGNEVIRLEEGQLTRQEMVDEVFS
ncbi:unnamed protein product [Blepharisma stoltei]|uniref:Thioredoxin domain-containing protein n=1 Tax=Blepharisma stoltei TaxID=1481888 RepID=A0AAU9JJT2_9CILI|nr:unnamed protein product [Blepharisma stoltei]